MDFQTAVRTCLQRKYADFTGRAQRSEFWYFALFNLVASLILSVLDGILFGSMGNGIGILGIIFSLAMLIPGIAVGIRRLHDLGKSGWWYLLIFVPVVGFLVLLYFFIQKGTDGANEFGPDPLAA